jgi:hypothetical protein
LLLDILDCNPKRGEGDVCYERNVVAVFATSVIWVAKQLRVSLFFYRSTRKKDLMRRVVLWELRTYEVHILKAQGLLARL